DGSRDATGERARAAGARVVGSGRPIGKGGAMTAAARVVGSGRPIGKGGAMTAAARAALIASPGAPGDVFVLCDGDLGDSAERLAPLVAAVFSGGADLAVAAFARRAGGGFGVALGFAGWAIERRCGLRARAPISGQRALRRA